VTTDPPSTQDRPAETDGPGLLQRGLARVAKGARHIATYFGLLALAGAGLVVIGKLLRMIGLSANSAHVARFAMLGLYAAAAITMARGKR
jgi:hypothetical protein